MDDLFFHLAAEWLDERYVASARDAFRSYQSHVRSVLAQRRMPDEGMSAAQVEHLLLSLSLLDSNNFSSHCGAGEREGRVVSSLVSRRYFYMSHGIGRSGDLTSEQPKACGSSLMYRLANAFALDALRLAGFESCSSALVTPSATGMSLVLVLLALRQRRPESRFVVWPRIDQRTALKCIEAAGLTVVPVALTRVRSGTNDDGGSAQPFYRVEAADIAAAIEATGSENVLCVLSTTSCFAPRVPDDPLAVARVCLQSGVPHVINNAYGVQSKWIMKRIDTASRLARVDAVVQSTDKNFLVPVGGAVLAAKDPVLIREASNLYPGRASASQALDLFVTLAEQGRRGLRQMLDHRYAVLDAFRCALTAFAASRREDCLFHEHNDISLCITMRHVDDALAVGGRLFRLGVTGPKVVVTDVTKELCGRRWEGYGSHAPPSTDRCPLLVLACGVGMTLDEVAGVTQKLERAWPAVRQQKSLEAPEASPALPGLATPPSGSLN